MLLNVIKKLLCNLKLDAWFIDTFYKLYAFVENDFFTRYKTYYVLYETYESHFY